jgi:methyltransferase (TIGR00027 family)
MQEHAPSRTALAAAAHRAVHQISEEGRIFADPLAVPILGMAETRLTELLRRAPESAPIRFFIASRSAIAEAALRTAFETRGARQAVVLGAGLDTFAYRNPFGSALRVFEVDHPSTQAWKRRQLAACGIETPPWLAFAPIDFERDLIAGALESAGWREDQRTVFIWLGVVPYLSRGAIERTLRQLGAFRGGSEVVFDYGEPAEALSPEARAAQARRAEAVAALGEPFLSYFDPDGVAALLNAAGFETVDDFGPHRLLERYLRDHAPDRLAADADWRRRPDRGGHVVVARTGP